MAYSSQHGLNKCSSFKTTELMFEQDCILNEGPTHKCCLFSVIGVKEKKIKKDKKAHLKTHAPQGVWVKNIKESRGQRMDNGMARFKASIISISLIVSLMT